MIFLRLLFAAIRILSCHGKAEPMSQEEITAALNQLQSEHLIRTGERLDWTQSVVDLMKVLGMDYGLHNRASLAAELGFEGTFIGDADQNIWLHSRILKRFRDGEMR